VARRRERGLERVAIEDPGWARHRLIAEGAGLEPVPVGVDGRALVLGYANLTEPATEQGLARVGEAFTGARGA